MLQKKLGRTRVKGSQKGAFYPKAIVYRYLEFKLRYLKNLKLFSMRVKLIFEPIDLQEKKSTVFCSFKSILSRNWSLSKARWCYGKKRKIGKRNLYLTENWLCRNKIWGVADNHNFVCHIFAKGVLDSIFNQAVDKTSNFHEIAPNFIKNFLWILFIKMVIL